MINVKVKIITAENSDELEEKINKFITYGARMEELKYGNKEQTVIRPEDFNEEQK